MSKAISVEEYNRLIKAEKQRAKRRGKPISNGEELFLLQIRTAGLPEPEREATLIQSRRWRFDFVWPDHDLVVEIEGGTWTQGRHTRGKGYASDCAKYNAAILRGWIVLRFTTEQVKQGLAIQMVRDAMADGGLAQHKAKLQWGQDG